jgi:hypothetical protein
VSRVLLVLIALLLTPFAAQAAVPAGNLVANPGAEASAGADDAVGVNPPASWGTTSNFTALVYGSPDFPGPRAGGGANFFAGGPDNAASLAEQVVDVSGAASDIDAGRVTLTLSADLGGFATQEDNARVAAVLEDANGDTTFATAQVGPVSAADRNQTTMLLPRTTQAAVPAGTRRIRVTIHATRVGGGSYNDGYADNVSLDLSRTEDPAPPPPEQPPPGPPADTSPPDTTITGGPANGASVGDAAPVYEFTASEPGSHFECRSYDPTSPTEFNASRLWGACASPHQTVQPLPDRTARIFEVRAVDHQGNADPSPAVRQAVNHGPGGPPPPPSKCRMVEVDRAHSGKKLLPGCRLAPIKRGKVPCMNVESRKVSKCRFKRRTGPWLESAKGPSYAMVGDSLSRDGDKAGPWIVAARPEPSPVASRRHGPGSPPPTPKVWSRAARSCRTAVWSRTQAPRTTPSRRRNTTGAWRTTPPARSARPTTRPSTLTPTGRSSWTLWTTASSVTAATARP